MGRFGNICALLRNWIINILVSHNKDPAYILIAKFGSLLNTSNYVQIALISIDFPYFHIWWGFHGISRISMFGSLLNIWTRCVGWHPHVFFLARRNVRVGQVLAWQQEELALLEQLPTVAHRGGLSSCGYLWMGKNYDLGVIYGCIYIYTQLLCINTPIYHSTYHLIWHIYMFMYMYI